MLDELKTEMGRRGWNRWTDGGSTMDRQRSDETWYAPTGVELRKTRGGEEMIWWDPERGAVTPEAVQRFGGTLGMKKVADDGKIFTRFLQLGLREDGAGKLYGEEEPKAVLDFAKRYGVFPICHRHGQPANGCPGRTLIDDHCDPRFPLVAQLAELSAQVRHVLKVAIRVEDEVEWSDWEQLIEILIPMDGRPQQEAVRETWRSAFGGEGGQPTHLVPVFVNRWLDYGSVGLRLEWQAVRPYKVGITVTSVLGALARQLFITVTGDKGLAVCSGCGELYTPLARKPKRGQKRWCDDCGKGNKYRVAKRIHAREYRRSTS